MLAALSTVASAWAGDFKVRTQLVWGTDEAKPAGKDYKELSAAMRDKLLNNLRWKNYFVVETRAETVSKEMCRFALSERCTVGLKPVGKDQIEVQIFNPMGVKPSEPVFMEKVSIESLSKGHSVAIGSNSKDRWDDAWLVIVTAGE